MGDPTFISGEIARVDEEKILSDEDRVAVEEPLEIRLGRSPIAVTMRTPGHDHELAAGFLFTEGIVRSPNDIATITGPIRDLPNVVSVKFRRGLRFDRSHLKRHFYTTSSCGVCGKATLEALEGRGCPVLPPGLAVGQDVICGLPATLGRG